MPGIAPSNFNFTVLHPHGGILTWNNEDEYQYIEIWGKKSIIEFHSGSICPQVDEILTGVTSGKTAKVIEVKRTGGEWGNGDASGYINLEEYHVLFQNGEDINGSIGGGNILTVTYNGGGYGTSPKFVIPGHKESQTIGSLDPDTQYCYKALGGWWEPPGETDFSNEDCETTYALLEAPSDLETTVFSNFVELTWKDNSSEEDFFDIARISLSDFRDDFDNGIGSHWEETHGITEDTTITVSGGVLIAKIQNAVDGRWWCTAANKAPKIIMDLDSIMDTYGLSLPLQIITKLNSYTVNDDTMAGIFIGKNPKGLGDINSNLAYVWGRFRDDTVGDVGYRLERNCGSYAYNNIKTLPVWLKILIAANENITFWYSINGIDWIQDESVTTISGYWQAGLKVGLFARNISSPYKNISAPFEYFEITGEHEWVESYATVPANVEYFRDTNVNPGQIYQYKVRAGQYE